MRILRCTMYPPPGNAPVTVVINEKSVTESLDKIARQMEIAGCFVVDDIFEVPDDLDELHATLKGMQRLEDSTVAQAEFNMAISYYWNAMQLRKIAPGGCLANPKPAPLTVKQIKTVLRQLHKHPDYNKQTIICVAEDNGFVQLFPNGDISVR